MPEFHEIKKIQMLISCGIAGPIGRRGPRFPRGWGMKNYPKFISELIQWRNDLDKQYEEKFGYQENLPDHIILIDSLITEIEKIYES